MDSLKSTVIRRYVLLFILYVKYTKQETNCSDALPKDVQEKYMCWSAGGGQSELDESFSQIQSLRDRVQNQNNNIFLDESTVLKYPLSSRHCPFENKTESPLLQDQANCPWYLEMTYSEERWPKQILQSKCKCKTCIGCDVTEIKCDEIRLLKKILLKSGTTWKNAYQTVYVGCTPVAIRQKPIIKSD
ncbi:hypothetical protein ACJMK2_012117 [Sinanodonta woodiana]|uniref:Uncharacterized protein n=1 Tax=Sinanodonta woodiana TaxID=1069815 RepID=A0ABD3V759_SINWO